MEFLKESRARPDGLAGLLPKRLQAVAGGVENEGQQVHGRERPGQVFLSMAEVVGQVIANRTAMLILCLLEWLTRCYRPDGAVES